MPFESREALLSLPIFLFWSKEFIATSPTTDQFSYYCNRTRPKNQF